MDGKKIMNVLEMDTIRVLNAISYMSNNTLQKSSHEELGRNGSRTKLSQLPHPTPNKNKGKKNLTFTFWEKKSQKKLRPTPVI